MPADTSKPSGHKTNAENAAKVQRRRNNERAEADMQPLIKREHKDHLIPDRDDLDLTGENVRHLGTVLAGIQDFKILRGSVAQANITTSTEFAHTLTDVSMISRASLLVAVFYEIPRADVFGDDGDADDDADDDGI